MAAHLASCESCYFIFSEAAQTRPPAEDASGRWWARRAVVATAALATAAALVLVVPVVPLGLRHASDKRAVEALVAAVGTERLIEPRLTGGFAYGPVRGFMPSGQAPVRLSLSPDIRIAVANIEKETTTQYSAAALHARGVAALLVGDVDRAIASLEAAAGQRADSAILSDLAGAYLVRADRTGNKDDFSKALATLNQALEVDPDLLEAHFNRAYALEHLALRLEARDAWQHYLAIDSRSPWAAEARLHLEQLSKKP
jgi:tetratricopeptide (TPR) repeat protein